MWLRVKKFLFGLLYEQNEPSLTRVIIAAAFLVFVAGTVVDILLAIYNIRWQDYATFATITGGGAMAGKVGDKLVNTIATQKYGMAEGRIKQSNLKNPQN